MMNKQIIGAILAAIIVISLVFMYFFIQQNENEEYDRKLIVLKNQVREELKKYNMIKRIRNNRGILEPKTNFTKINRLSHYQTFITPNHPSVTSYIQSQGINTVNEAYSTAVQWIWVSDQILHGVNEKWVKPRVFILDTPNRSKYPTNPVNGMASDCESQAYTLVSILESIGIPPEQVRVCIGLVDFGSGSGGHAWVQVYSNNQWYELEATTGPYYDEDSNKLVNSSGVSINYFKTRPYPVEEYWAFFNDKYYYNPDTGVKSNNLPNYWMTTEKKFTLKELKERIENHIVSNE